MGVVADPAGRRLVTLEQEFQEPVPETDDMLAGVEPIDVTVEYHLGLWELDRLDPPRTELARPMVAKGVAGRSIARPLVAISPDGKTIAVVRPSGTAVRLFSDEEGPIRSVRTFDTQTEVSAPGAGAKWPAGRGGS